ncbi:MAG: pantetheine-phosphate adenylyltransferase [Alphaproteobacteria bacterium]|nr:pantetheine-phosphate adenylyltransferase [Alphaproteobacteria bacterium]
MEARARARYRARIRTAAGRHPESGGVVKRVGLYPGTFDPITNGHLDIIGRAVKLVDKLIIGVAVNRDKGPLFSLEERVEMVMRETARFSGHAEIEARPFENLLIKYAESCEAKVIIRGLRAVSDFEYEFQMVAMNQKMNHDIETVFLMADPMHQAVSSRLVKEIARLDGSADLFVPPDVYRRLKERFERTKGAR